MIGMVGQRAAGRREPRGVRQVGQRAEDRRVDRAERLVVVQQMRDGEPVAGHLRVRLQRLDRLGPERVGMAVPEEPAVPRDVPERRRVARPDAVTLRHHLAVREGAGRIVARRARDLAAGREPGVEEQLAAEPGGPRIVGERVGRIRGGRSQRRVLQDPLDLLGREAHGAGVDAALVLAERDGRGKREHGGQSAPRRRPVRPGPAAGRVDRARFLRHRAATSGAP
jgi:hypothetical protein